MDVTLGRIVHYKLSPHDVAEITDHRVRRQLGGPPIEVGQEVAAVVTSVYAGESSTCNLRLILDGYDFFWALRRYEGDVDGSWHWPERVQPDPPATSGEPGGAHT